MEIPSARPATGGSQLFALDWVFGPLGAVIGGVAAYFVFSWLVGQGIYAMALPGALIGLGCGWKLRRRRFLLGIFCGIVSICFCIFLEWKFFHSKMEVREFLSEFCAFERYHREKMIMAVGTILSVLFGTGRNS